MPDSPRLVLLLVLVVDFEQAEKGPIRASNAQLQIIFGVILEKRRVNIMPVYSVVDSQ